MLFTSVHVNVGTRGLPSFQVLMFVEPGVAGVVGARLAGKMNMLSDGFKSKISK